MHCFLVAYQALNAIGTMVNSARYEYNGQSISNFVENHHTIVIDLEPLYNYVSYFQYEYGQHRGHIFKDRPWGSALYLTIPGIFGMCNEEKSVIDFFYDKLTESTTPRLSLRDQAPGNLPNSNEEINAAIKRFSKRGTLNTSEHRLLEAYVEANVIKTTGNNCAYARLQSSWAPYTVDIKQGAQWHAVFREDKVRKHTTIIGNTEYSVDTTHRGELLITSYKFGTAHIEKDQLKWLASRAMSEGWFCRSGHSSYTKLDAQYYNFVVA